MDRTILSIEKPRPMEAIEAWQSEWLCMIRLTTRTEKEFFNMTQAMRFSMFSGLCPVRIPAEWVADESIVRWAAQDGIQYVDFTGNGGPALAFSVGGGKPFPGVVEYRQSIVSPNYTVINPATVPNWSDRKTGGIYVEAYITSQIFGTSAQVIDLVPPEQDDGVRVFPPATLGGIPVDTSVPVRYYWTPDNFGGCGFFYAFVRTPDGGVLEGYIGQDPWIGWGKPHFNEETPYEEYVKLYADSRENPEKILPMHWRVSMAEGQRFETDVFLA